MSARAGYFHTAFLCFLVPFTSEKIEFRKSRGLLLKFFFGYLFIVCSKGELSLSKKSDYLFNVVYTDTTYPN